MKSSESRMERMPGRRVKTHPFAAPIFFFVLLTLYSPLSTSVSAQDDIPGLAPPPRKVISKGERTRLDAETNIRDRTKLTLEMMDERLSAAEKLSDGKDFDAMFQELGGFHGLMDNGIEFLLKKDDRKNKVLDNLKRIEIGLRGFAPRLESIRRDVPLSYENYVRKLISYLRNARTRVSEPLFSDTVVPDPKSSDKN